jgi:hypothetical protein
VTMARKTLSGLPAITAAQTAAGDLMLWRSIAAAVGQKDRSITRDQMALIFQPYSASLVQVAGLDAPGADRLLFYDHSALSYAHLTLGANLTITGTTLDAAGGTALPVADTTAVVMGSSDPDNRLLFDLDTLGLGNDVTLTVPSASCVIAGRDVNNSFSASQSFTSGSIILTAANPTANVFLGVSLAGPVRCIAAANGGTLATQAADRCSMACVDFAAGDARWVFRSEQGADLYVGNGTVTGLSAGVSPSDAVNKAQLDAAVTGLLDLKGSTDCSASPNYPAASKGDIYLVSAAGKIGGASGKAVDAGDFYLALADNAGGDEAAVGASWSALEHNVLALGTAAFANTGTSGGAVGLLNGNNTHSGANTFTGQVLLKDGTSSSPGLAFTSNGDLGLYRNTNNTVKACANSQDVFLWSQTTFMLGQSIRLTWGSSGLGSDDVGIERAAAGVLRTDNASTGDGWLQVSAGRRRVAGDATNATVTPANLTDLTASLKAGRKYLGELVLFCSEATAADGLRLDFDGGTATVTSFVAQGWLSDDTSTRPLARVTALATDIVDSTITGSTVVTIKFSLVCNAAGTFVPRFAKEADAAGAALTVAANSYLFIEDVP